jgi:hypothetical protein
MKTWEWKQQMKGLGKLVAFGVYPCAAKGHTLRTRAGHCIQCNTANLSYLKRMNESADVYVAWSKGSKLVKNSLFGKDSIFGNDSILIIVIFLLLVGFYFYIIRK